MWSNPLPTCIAINCEQPTLPNGDVNSTSTAFGATIHYSCNDGYVLEGSVNSTCVHNGTGNRQGKLSNPPPTCTKITCERPTVQNGNVTVTSIKLGSVIQYTCNDGYVLAGKMNSTCVHNGTGNRQGQWSNPSPNCMEITCLQPLFSNGRAITDSLKFGGTVRYLCNEGFALKGKTTSICISSDVGKRTGRWLDPTPICSEITCEPPILRNGSATADSLKYGGTVNYACDDGYILEGEFRTICGRKGSEEGKWQDRKPICIEITCDIPTHPDNGVAVADSRKLGGKVRYFCRKGYLLNGNKDIATCVRNGTTNARGAWSNRTPICSPVTKGYSPVRSLESSSPGNDDGFGSGVGCGIGIMLLIALVVGGICILIKKRKYIARLHSLGSLNPKQPEEEKEVRDFNNPVYGMDETESYGQRA
ncbi:sushi, von Willebrand factor type A, EGF and pentraxin domain-containing protein 1-like [Lineus longissimus]|uniref:sushi, von Willebrand factor type A, EGF and pentraxin domain-containing protein 1-like n=1 Tax=Lineus longissimus TaxID=88925 RepID=UPI002B4E3323